MRIRVLFFGLLRDLVGRGSDDCDVPPGTSLEKLFTEYAARFPRIRELAPSIVVARNQEFAGLSTLVEEGDEIAFLPPVSGGVVCDPLEIAENGNYYALTRHAIDSRAIVARI